MKKLFFLVGGLAYLLMLPSCQQEIEITPELTIRHQPVQSQRLYLLKPPNFNRAKTYDGVQHINYAASVSVRYLDHDLNTNLEKYYNKKKLKQRGLDYESSNKVKYGKEHKGKFFEFEQDKKDFLFTKYIFLLEVDTTLTLEITGVVPKKSKKSKIAIRKRNRSVIGIEDLEKVRNDVKNIVLNVGFEKEQLYSSFE